VASVGELVRSQCCDDFRQCHAFSDSASVKLLILYFLSRGVRCRVSESQGVGGFWVESESDFLSDSGSPFESFLILHS